MGKVCDFGVTDVNNMGAAMAPVSVIIGQNCGVVIPEIL